MDGNHVNFTCYLSDGFDVSTTYPKSIPFSSQKLIRSIVKSSLQEAFEFHKHHVRQQISEHGKPKQFQSLQEVLDWEDQQKYSQDMQKTSVKLIGRILIRSLIGLVISFVITLIISIGIALYFDLQGSSVISIIVDYGIFFVMPAFFAGQLWALKPLYRPETVESRKKKELAEQG